MRGASAPSPLPFLPPMRSNNSDTYRYEIGVPNSGKSLAGRMFNELTFSEHLAKKFGE